MSNIFQKIKKGILHPSIIYDLYITKHAEKYDDEVYLRKKFKIRFGVEPNLNDPKTFNEKLTWLKLHDHNPLYHTLVDKYKVKEFVQGVIGAEYVVPSLGVWDNFDEIDWAQLPQQFVIKTTHDSSGAIIVRDKSKLDLAATKEHIEVSLNRSWFYPLREWVYKDVSRRIIADTFLDDNSHDGSGISLLDYKFWCFNGEPRAMYITVKDKVVFENFYDRNFKPLPINHGFERHQPEFAKPKGFETMWDLAGKLSKATGAPFVRVDFFNVAGKIYFGEFTFYDWGGMKPFKDNSQDVELGSWLDLSNVKKQVN